MADRPLLAQFGAGNIGRSLVGQLFSRAGWEVCFLDVAEPVIDALNEKRGYRVVVKDDLLPGEPDHFDIRNVYGVNLNDRDRAVEVVERADLVGTSVGAANIPAVCEVIGKALLGRERPLSVMLCENLHGAAAFARRFLAENLPDGYPLDAQAGLVEAAISKMVPATPPEVRKADPLQVWAEAYNTLYLDGDAYVGGTPPAVPGVAWRSGFGAYVDRKLLLHNFGHAATAYMGFLAGKTYIWECMEDEGVRAVAAGCMMETSRGLAQRHSGTFTFDENRAWADDLLRRFHNKALGDPVYRVGRDLRRKLAPEDRCIGALKLLAETGVPYAYTAKAVAAGLKFAAVDVDGAFLREDRLLVERAAKEGPESVLTDVSGLNASRDAALIAAVASEYRTLP